MSLIAINAYISIKVGVYLVGPLATTKNGNRYLLTCCCYFTKWAEAVPLEDKTAETVATELFRLQCQKGSASIFIHDQGTEFVNQINRYYTCALCYNTYYTVLYYTFIVITILLLITADCVVSWVSRKGFLLLTIPRQTAWTNAGTRHYRLR
jgi:hypothetical protein